MSGVWKSPAEWAALALPGLPGTERGVQLRAERDSWPRQHRDGKQGGGWKYPLSALPREARSAYLARAAEAVPSVPAPTASTMPATPAPTRDGGGLADWQRRCMDARAAILMEVERLAAIGGQAAAMREVIARAADGRLRPDLQALVPIANAKAGKDGRRTLSRATLFRWKQEAAAAGATALAPRASAPAQSRVPAWAPALLKLYRVPTKRSLAAVMEDLPAALPPGVAVPSYAAARRFLQSMSTVDRERGRHGPNGLLKFRAFKRRSTADLEPMDVVTSDGHTHKSDVAHPVHQRPFRPELCAILDVATRYAFGWSAGLAESSLVVMDCIRHGVERLGQFGLYYTDNGAGFTAEMMTAEITGLLGRIGSTPTTSIPGRAQARGKIERFQAVWKRAARKTPTYSGRDMDNEARRKVVKLVDAEIKARGASRLLMSWPDFLNWAQDEIDAYNNRPHRGLPKIRCGVTGKMRHMSPAECLKGWIESGWEPSRLPPEIMDSLFRPELERTTSRGEVTLPWGRYFARELEHWTGERVRVAYDIHDGGRVWVRTLDDGRLICTAERDGNVIPEQPASKVEHARRTRETARLKLLERHAAEVRAEAGPELIEYRPVQSMEIDAAQASLIREMEAATRPAPTIVVDNDNPAERPIPSDPDARFAFWCDVDAGLRAGGDVGERLGRWHEIYQTLPEFRARWQMWTEFGGATPNSAAG